MEIPGQVPQRLPSSAFVGDINSAIEPIEEARNPFVKMGVDYWRSLCGKRRFPARNELTLRGMAAFIPYVVIVDALDNGADYEYQYVGEAQRQAFGTYFRGIRLSQIEAALPELGAILRGPYDQVCSTGVPFVLRGRAGTAADDSKLSHHETVFLPLGVGDDVENLLVVGVQVPELYRALSDDELKSVAG